MPKMWLARDGNRPNSQSISPVPITNDEAVAIVGGSTIRFLGLKPPSIDPDHPSTQERHVLLEVEDNEVDTAFFKQPGLYFIVGVSPSMAEERLTSHRMK